MYLGNVAVITEKQKNVSGMLCIRKIHHVDQKLYSKNHSITENFQIFSTACDFLTTVKIYVQVNASPCKFKWIRFDWFFHYFGGLFYVFTGFNDWVTSWNDLLWWILFIIQFVFMNSVFGQIFPKPFFSWSIVNSSDFSML